MVITGMWGSGARLPCPAAERRKWRQDDQLLRFGMRCGTGHLKSVSFAARNGARQRRLHARKLSKGLEGGRGMRKTGKVCVNAFLAD